MRGRNLPLVVIRANAYGDLALDSPLGFNDAGFVYSSSKLQNKLEGAHSVYVRAKAKQNFLGEL